jgi:hypothetical protein
MGKKNNSDNLIGEGFGTREDLEEVTANGSGPEKVKRDKRQLVFDVLTVLANTQNAKKNENETKGSYSVGNCNVFWCYFSSSKLVFSE